MHHALARLPTSVLALIWSNLYDAPANCAQHGSSLWQIIYLLPPAAFAAVVDHLPAVTLQAMRHACRALHVMLSHHNVRLMFPDDFEGPMALLLGPLTSTAYPFVRHVEFGTLSDVLICPPPTDTSPPGSPSDPTQLTQPPAGDTSTPHNIPHPLLPATLSFLGQITHLVCHCRLSSPALLTTFVQLISSTPNLHALNYDIILDPDDGVGHFERLNFALLPHLPSSCPRLRSLTLPHVRKTEPFSASTLAALTSLTHLTRLHLHDVNALDSEESQAVALSLLPLTNLVSLALPLPIASPLFTILPSPITPLTFLKLTQTYPTATTQLPAFPNQPPPVALSLQGPSVLPPLLPHTIHLTRLRHLSLSQLHISDSDLLALSPMSLLTSLSLLPLTTSTYHFTGCHLSRLCSPRSLQSLSLRASAFHPSVPTAICQFTGLTRLAYLLPQPPLPLQPRSSLSVTNHPDVSQPSSSTAAQTSILSPSQTLATHLASGMSTNPLTPHPTLHPPHPASPSTPSSPSETTWQDLLSSLPSLQHLQLTSLSQEGWCALVTAPSSLPTAHAHETTSLPSPNSLDSHPFSPAAMDISPSIPVPTPPAVPTAPSTAPASPDFLAPSASAKVAPNATPVLPPSGTSPGSPPHRPPAGISSHHSPDVHSHAMSTSVSSSPQAAFRPSPTPLRQLSVGHLHLTASLVPLKANLVNLTHLAITGGPSKATDRATLAALPPLVPRLRDLKISCAVHMDNAILLSCCENCPALRRLDLAFLKEVGEGAAEQLTSLVHLTKLNLMFDRRSRVDCDRLAAFLGSFIQRVSVEM